MILAEIKKDFYYYNGPYGKLGTDRIYDNLEPQDSKGTQIDFYWFQSLFCTENISPIFTEAFF